MPSLQNYTDEQLIKLYWDAMESQDGKLIKYCQEEIKRRIREE